MFIIFYVFAGSIVVCSFPLIFFLHNNKLFFGGYMKAILLLVVFLTIIITSYSQVNIEWASFYNGPASAGSANAIAVDNSGNVYVTGKSDGGATDYDIATVKYNSNGAQVWAARYNGVQGDGWDEGFAIAVDNSGNVYVCGTASESDLNYNFCTVKYNSAGVQQWVRIIDGGAHSDDFAFALAADNSGNVYVTGYISQSGGAYNMCTVKYNSAGNPDWTIYYGGPANIRAIAFGIKLDGSGNVYVGGECQSITTASDYFVAKYSNGGTVQWIKLYIGISNDFVHGFDVDNSGNSYITGESSFDYCTVKLKPNGDSVWVRRYDGPEHGGDQPFSVAADPFGNAIVTGVSFDILGNTSAMATVKYDTAGVQKWVNRYSGTTGFAVSFAVVTDQTGNSYITGRDFSSCTIKYNPAGVQQWVKNTDSISTARGIAADIQIALDVERQPISGVPRGRRTLRAL